MQHAYYAECLPVVDLGQYFLNLQGMRVYAFLRFVRIWRVGKPEENRRKG